MSLTSTLRSVYDVASDRHITLLAASFAYYAFVSVIPLLTLALVVGTLLGGEAFADRLLSVISDHLSGNGEDIVREALQNEQGRAGAGLVSGLFLLWSALKVFRGMSVAFDVIYGEFGEGELLEQVRDGLLVIGAVVIAVGLMVGVGALLRNPAFVAIPYPGVVGSIVLIAGLVLAFLPLYYVLPPTSMTIPEALPGTILAAVGWLLLQAGFQIYASSASRYAAYGVLGAILLFVTWLYFAGILLLLGAVVNFVLAGRRSGFSFGP